MLWKLILIFYLTSFLYTITLWGSALTGYPLRGWLIFLICIALSGYSINKKP